jgi:hypothetical protein
LPAPQGHFSPIAPAALSINVLLNDVICYSVFLIFLRNDNTGHSFFVPVSRSKNGAKNHLGGEVPR